MRRWSVQSQQIKEQHLLSTIIVIGGGGSSINMDNRALLIKASFSTAECNTAWTGWDLGVRTTNQEGFEEIEAWGDEDRLEQDDCGKGKR